MLMRRAVRPAAPQPGATARHWAPPPPAAGGTCEPARLGPAPSSSRAEAWAVACSGLHGAWNGLGRARSASGGTRREGVVALAALAALATPSVLLLFRECCKRARPDRGPPSRQPDPTPTNMGMAVEFIKWPARCPAAGLFNTPMEMVAGNTATARPVPGQGRGKAKRGASRVTPWRRAAREPRAISLPAVRHPAPPVHSMGPRPSQPQ